MQPVPEPTVRDLSVPQAKGPRFRKTTLPSGAKELAGKDEAAASRQKPEPAEEGEVIPAREVAAATTAEVLGRNPSDQQKAEDEKPAEANSQDHG